MTKAKVEEQDIALPTAQQQRVLILAPTGRDSSISSQVLRSGGIESRPCGSAQELCEAMKAGVGAVLLTDEALTNEAVACILQVLDEQEPWSDIPLIVFPANGENGVVILERLGIRANVTLLERPVRIEILVNAVKSALRARRRQYEARNMLLQLSKADREKDLFLATLSHELRTPLSSILGWARLLKTGELDAEKAAMAVDVINRNATAQAQLISDILSLSQIVAGTLRIERVPLDLNVAIRAALDSIRPAADAKGIHIEYSFENNGPILGDPNRLQQIIANVLSNAIKFTPRNGSVNVRTAAEGPSYAIIVRDTGKGIPPEFLAHVFEHFRQEDSSYTRTEGGLGLGLAIVRHLVELHGGTVCAESEGTGKGATFTIRLPLDTVDRQPDINSGGLGAATTMLAGVRVVVVDDDRDCLELLENVLSEHGATVAAANSAQSALGLISAAPPDVLVSDIGMPGEDGYALLNRALAVIPRKRVLPAIALTGYASLTDRETAFAAGYQVHLSKPFEPMELVSWVKKLAASGRGTETRD